jgi:hypothetical protein
MKKFLIPVVLIILTPIVVAVVIMSQQTTLAQKIVDTPLLAYDASNYGFKINYPKNWKGSELSGGKSFVAPAETFTDKYQSNAEISVNSFELPSQTRTLVINTTK